MRRQPARHAANGISVSDAIANLAGQHVSDLESQLRALKKSGRKNPVMNAIATQLGTEEIANVAAYFSSLPGGAGTAKSDFLPALTKTQVSLPERVCSSYTKCHTINFSATRQVRYDYATLARDEGSCRDIPEMLRNEEWNYAAFTTAEQLRPSNQAECLACHKPLDKVSDTFTIDCLTAVAQGR